MTLPFRHHQRNYPFELRIDGLVGYFREASGLISTPEWNAFEREQCEVQDTVETAQLSWLSVKLKDGYSQDKALWAWQNSTTNQPDAYQHHCSVIQYSRQRDIVSTWYLRRIRPAHLYGLFFDAESGGYCIEEFAFFHDGLTRHLPETEMRDTVWAT